MLKPTKETVTTVKTVKTIKKGRIEEEEEKQYDDAKNKIILIKNGTINQTSVDFSSQMINKNLRILTELFLKINYGENYPISGEKSELLTGEKILLVKDNNYQRYKHALDVFSKSINYSFDPYVVFSRQTMRKENIYDPGDVFLKPFIQTGDIFKKYIQAMMILLSKRTKMGKLQCGYPSCLFVPPQMFAGNLETQQVSLIKYNRLVFTCDSILKVSGIDQNITWIAFLMVNKNYSSVSMKLFIKVYCNVDQNYNDESEKENKKKVFAAIGLDVISKWENISKSLDNTKIFVNFTNLSILDNIEILNDKELKNGIFEDLSNPWANTTFSYTGSKNIESIFWVMIQLTMTKDSNFMYGQQSKKIYSDQVVEQNATFNDLTKFLKKTNEKIKSDDEPSKVNVWNVWLNGILTLGYIPYTMYVDQKTSFEDDVLEMLLKPKKVRPEIYNAVTYDTNPLRSKIMVNRVNITPHLTKSQAKTLIEKVVIS